MKRGTHIVSITQKAIDKILKQIQEEIDAELLEILHKTYRKGKADKIREMRKHKIRNADINDVIQITEL